MNLVERIRSMFTTPQSAELLEGVVQDLGRAVAEAEARTAEKWAAHRDRALEFASMSDSTVASRSRAACEAADDRVADLTAALEAAKRRLQTAQEARQAQEASKSWETARSQLTDRSASVQRLQSLLVEVAAEYSRLESHTAACWDACPVVPTFRPPTFGADLRTRVEMYLHGASRGRLGDSPNAHVSSRKPDLVQLDAEAVALLLAPSQTTVEA